MFNWCFYRRLIIKTNIGVLLMWSDNKTDIFQPRGCYLSLDADITVNIFFLQSDLHDLYIIEFYFYA